MARSPKTAQEFIQSSFSPIVAALCSSKVENVVGKNNLSFTELLQPFTSFDWEGQFREPGGTVCSVKNLKIIVRDVHWKPLQPTEARRHLNEAVLHNYNEKTVAIEYEGHKFDIPQSTPWFDAWRETYLEVQFPSDHEFTKHFLSCILVATTHEENIIDVYTSLIQQCVQLQNVAPPKLPKWFNSEPLKSYLLLHDVSSVSKDKADAAFDTLKQTFGANNCFMLSINSKNTVDPCLPVDYWSYIKRSREINSEMSSSMTTSPVEPATSFPPNTQSIEDNTVVNPELMHPLATAEHEVYDNANSLQAHSLSGSTESMSVSGKLTDYSTEIHGAALNSADIDAVKKFLDDYASKALLPHLEKQISQLSEAVATRKGVSRSLISATKRWFGTAKPGNTTVNNTVIYSGDCQELQLRRLGDLWFLCGQWQRAFDAYHTAKREFYADSAWLCYAGALEMAALSAFMAGEANRKTHGYMEESIVTYLNTCRMVQYAVRATLLSVVCLNSSGLQGDAAKQLIRMTSEDSDLRSAMLLEQAALSFLPAPANKAMCRKYAFHMVLAGHRFSRAGQKKHAYRCYKQAYQVYVGGGWRLATDHVQFALGRLSGALRLPRQAVRWLRAPLAPHSLQPPHQQAAFLREYMLAHQQWIESSDEFKDQLPDLPLPLLELEATTVLCVGPAPLSSPGRVPATSLNMNDDQAPTEAQYWGKMEEMLLQVAQGSVPMIFKPSIDFYTMKTDSNPVVPQAEPIQISITLTNPLKIPLILKDVELLWKFVASPTEDGQPINKEVLSNEGPVATGSSLETNVIHGQKIKSVLLEGECKKVLNFTITPLRVGHLNIEGLAYKLYNVGENGTDTGSVMITGKLNLVLGNNTSQKLLQIVVIAHAPCLQMTFSETNTNLISGEMLSVDMELRNVGPIDMKNVYIAVSHPDCVSLLMPDATDDFRLLYEDKYMEPPTFADERAARAAAWRAAASRHTWRAAAGVPRGAQARAALLLRPAAPAPLRLLAYYETGNPARPYRLLRHVFRFTNTDAVEMSIVPRRSMRTVGDSISEIMNLAVEVKNVSDDKANLEVEILQASLLSQQWVLTDLTAARNKNDFLSSHERHHLIFKAKRILDTLPEGNVKHSSLKVASTYPDDSDDVNVPPYSKFLTDYKSSVFSTETPSMEVNTDKGLIQSMFVLRWRAHDRANGQSTVGQHCLWLDCFAKAKSIEKEVGIVDLPALQLEDYESKTDSTDVQKNTKDNVVVFRLEHTDHIVHNFKARKLCLVPMTLNIVNCYGTPVNVFIDMSKKQDRDSSSLGWVGALGAGAGGAGGAGVRVSLGRFAHARVGVRACVAAPGAYVLGALPVCSRARTAWARDSSVLVVQAA